MPLLALCVHKMLSSLTPFRLRLLGVTLILLPLSLGLQAYAYTLESDLSCDKCFSRRTFTYCDHHERGSPECHEHFDYYHAAGWLLLVVGWPAAALLLYRQLNPKPQTNSSTLV